MDIISGQTPGVSTVQRPPAALMITFGLMAGVGCAAFLLQLLLGDAPRAWQAYLVSFLLFSAVAQGAVLFSTLMHVVGARWSGPLADLAEAFSAFFPVSFVLLLLLFAAGGSLFPWLHEELHGKEVWLNLRFMFARDAAGLLLLYGAGFAYLYHALYFKLRQRGASGPVALWLLRRFQEGPPDDQRRRRRMTIYAVLYMLAFALVLSLLGYDLVMSMDPEWVSTLFGAYTFVKAIYVGFGAVIILAALLHMNPSVPYRLKDSQFIDIGKLFFAFCLVWADFFYAQLVVIWYGNISEETAYVIQRTNMEPWRMLALAVFGVCFIAPFLILINRKVKTLPAAMITICGTVIAGMWLEHFLLLGPVYHHHVRALPLAWIDGAVAIGFLGLLAGAVAGYIGQFPEIVFAQPEEGHAWKS